MNAALVTCAMFDSGGVAGVADLIDVMRGSQANDKIAVESRATNRRLIMMCANSYDEGG